MASQRIGSAVSVPLVCAPGPPGGQSAPARPRWWLLDLGPWALRAYVAAMVAAGAVALAAAASPWHQSPQACSPSEQGTAACELSHGWLRSAIALAVMLLLTHLAARAALDWVPRLARARASRARRGRAVPAAGSAEHERMLLAACWGDVGASRRPDPQALARSQEVWQAALPRRRAAARAAPMVCLDCVVLVDEPGGLTRCPTCAGPLAVTRRPTGPAESPYRPAGGRSHLL